MPIKEWGERATTFFKSRRGQRVLIAAGIIGMLLILLSSLWPKSSNQKDTAADSVAARDYVAALEKQLTALVGCIDGAGRCEVMVTLENGVEYVYASEQRVNSDHTQEDGTSSTRLSQSEDSQQSVILVDTDDGRQGLLVTEMQPTIRGVVIVCDGGDQPVVCERIQAAVTTALNLTQKRVCITKMGGI